MHVWNRRRLQAFFDDTKTVCMHVYGLPVGASKHARSLDEIRTVSTWNTSPRAVSRRSSGPTGAPEATTEWVTAPQSWKIRGFFRAANKHLAARQK